MEILLIKGITTFISNTFSKTRYDIYSVTQLTNNTVKALIRTIDAGQDIDIEMKSLEAGLTSYKFKYMCELSCDSGD